MSKPTIFQNLNAFLMGNDIPKVFNNRTTTYNISQPADDIIYKTNDKDDYNRKLAQLRQQKLLSYQWVKAGNDNAQQSLAGLTNVKLMYRDSDLMDGFPEIGAALDIISEEACCLSAKGSMINVYSKSPRIKSILEDLFINRLDLHIILPMIVRGLCKYGNNFMLLNLSYEDGVTGWRQLPVYEIERQEGEITSENPFTVSVATKSDNEINNQETKFVWVGHNEGMPYKDWQVAHFRLLTDSFFLPYGVSWLHKARRSWRMLSMMEDAMLIYRLDKSIERRVFKIFVGAIDDQDVPAYVQEIANNFKRTPVIDPLTGQVDLKKNFMDVSTDYFIPVRTEGAPSPIETLPGATNQTSMDDIKYMENKVLSALRIPKSFLNFEDGQGKGQNLSLMDIRFCRMVNRVQQAVLLELNKIATIHLYLLGFLDDLTNFSITMNNPSSQIEAQELEDITKRITVAQTLLADPGNGIQIWSLHKVCKDILKMSEKEIEDNLNEIRLEKALAMELQLTPQIIQRTGIFDPVDRIYGDPEAEYNMQQAMGGDDGGMGGGGGGGLGGGLGGDLGGDTGGMDMGGEDGSAGTEGTTDMGGAPAADAGGASPSADIPESVTKKGNLITEDKSNNVKDIQKSAFDAYLKLLSKKSLKESGEIPNERVEVYSKNLLINESTNSMINGLNELTKKLTDIENNE